LVSATWCCQLPSRVVSTLQQLAEQEKEAVTRCAQRARQRLLDQKAPSLKRGTVRLVWVSRSSLSLLSLAMEGGALHATCPSCTREWVVQVDPVRQIYGRPDARPPARSMKKCETSEGSTTMAQQAQFTDGKATLDFYVQPGRSDRVVLETRLADGSILRLSASKDQFEASLARQKGVANQLGIPWPQ
jgi:hypothetical protein